MSPTRRAMSLLSRDKQWEALMDAVQSSLIRDLYEVGNNLLQDSWYLSGPNVLCLKHLETADTALSLCNGTAHRHIQDCMLAIIVPQDMSDWKISLCECDKQVRRLSWLTWPQRLKIASKISSNWFYREQNKNKMWDTNQVWLSFMLDLVHDWVQLRFENDDSLDSFLALGERFSGKVSIR